MPVQPVIAGIDGPQAPEDALTAAYYVADDGIATAGYLRLASGSYTHLTLPPRRPV